jgi:hypothetical protein
MGCSSVSYNQKDIYAQGYRDAVKSQMNEIVAGLQGGEFPYYYWHKPIVQYVQVPAQVHNGVMIPAHEELVLIKPGEWKQQMAYPITTQGGTNENQRDSAHDITVLPGDWQ